MARRKKSGGDGGGSGDWLNTYADMVTLLLTFFILLFSMSSLDAAKFNMMVSVFASDKSSTDQIVIFAQGDGSLENQAANMNPDATVELESISLEDIYDRLLEYIQEAGMQDAVEVSHGDGYVFIRFMDEMLFQPNSARLKNPDMEILNFVGRSIQSVQHEVEMISINGHTAAIPDDPDYAVSDWLLSSERANAILMYFEENCDIESDKMLSIGWGKHQPLPEYADNATEESRAKNRRVEILINAEHPIKNQLENVYEKLMDDSK